MTEPQKFTFERLLLFTNSHSKRQFEMAPEILRDNISRLGTGALFYFLLNYRQNIEQLADFF